MRKIFAFERVSADGSFADARGGLDWVVPDAELDREASSRRGADTLIFGRRTYEMMASFWPKVGHGEVGANPHGAPSPQMLSFARTLNAATKVVFSRSLPAATWGPARLLRDFDVGAMQDLKQQPGSDILV